MIGDVDGLWDGLWAFLSVYVPGIYSGHRNPTLSSFSTAFTYSILLGFSGL